MEQELAPPLASLDSAIVSVATAQANLLQRISATMEGTSKVLPWGGQATGPAPRCSRVSVGAGWPSLPATDFCVVQSVYAPLCCRSCGERASEAPNHVAGAIGTASPRVDHCCPFPNPSLVPAPAHCAALRSIEAEDASLPSLELYAQKLENAKKRLGWLCSIVGNVAKRVEATVARVQRAPPPGLPASSAVGAAPFANRRGSSSSSAVTSSGQGIGAVPTAAASGSAVAGASAAPADTSSVVVPADDGSADGAVPSAAADSAGAATSVGSAMGDSTTS